MVRLSKRKKRFAASLSIAIAAGLLFCLLSHFNLLHGIHLQSSDFLYRAADSTPGEEPDNRAVIVAIDDKSLDQLGRFSSWPRAYHARLVNALAGSGARVIVFDILFSEASHDDGELLAAIRQAGNVILPVAGTMDTYQSAMTGKTTASGNVIRPLKPFEESALAVGHANVVPDEDGIVRRLPLLIQDDAQYKPALALTAIAEYLRRPQIIEAPVEENHLSFAGRSIPLDDAGNMLIDYGGTPASTVSYVDVLRSNISPDTFKDKIVVIGITAIGFGDTFWTPVGQIMSGVEVHAHAMHTILTGNFMRPAPAYITILSILLLALFCGLVVLRLRVLWAALSAVSLGIIYLLTAFYFFDQGTVLDMLYPPLTLATSFVGVNLYSVTSERLEKKEITRTFGRYVSPPVVEKILLALEDGELKLGGEERQVTVLFADARNFTGIAENTPPQELVRELNKYLSVIIRAAIRYNGMVNKFGGDSVMAVWNAPIGCQEHALLATKAALSAQQALRELQESGNLLKMEFGMGINTGNALAGNMGSTDRLEYSVVGDVVNTAARLSGVAPGGRVWVGASTFDMIRDYVRAIPLEPLPLRGKREAVPAYEIVDVQNGPSEDHQDINRRIGAG